MSETTCRETEDGYLLNGEHFDLCDDQECRGCFPCVPRSDHGETLGHCTARRRCVVHVPDGELTCPRCLAKTRGHISDLVRMDALMPEEAEERGVNSEAANLAGPAPDTTDDIRAYANRQSSIAMGRVDGKVEATARHPLNVLGWYEMAIREDYDHPSTLRITVDRAAEYLNEQLQRFANDPEQDFPEFVQSVQQCRAHMSAVLHDHDQGDRANVGCFDCKGSLERRLTNKGFEDVWTCRRCDRVYTYAEYNFALRARLEENRGNEAAAKEPA